MLRWEFVEHDGPGELDRVPVPNGWMVRHTYTKRDDTLSITFVPDPDHTWLLKEGRKEGQKWADDLATLTLERDTLRAALDAILVAHGASDLAMLYNAVKAARFALYRPSYDTSQEQSDANG